MLVLIGSQGSMGRRYQAILKYLGIQYQGFDLGDGAPWEAVSQSDGVIIATPTSTHWSMIQRIGSEIPILCEKPLSTNLKEVEAILSIPNPLNMMSQYRFISTPPGQQETLYDYYASGQDGLAWDCVTLLGLARGPVTLRQTSPIWTCWLNGKVLTHEEVERSYIAAVEDWLRCPEWHRVWGRSWMRRAHQRAATWVAETPTLTICSQSLGAEIPRNPSADPASPPTESTDPPVLGGSLPCA